MLRLILVMALLVVASGCWAKRPATNTGTEITDNAIESAVPGRVAPSASGAEPVDDEDAAQNGKSLASTPHVKAYYASQGRVGFGLDHSTLGEMAYLFWGTPWEFAYNEAKDRRSVGGKERFTVEVPDLGLAIAGQVKRSTQRLEVDYSIEASRDLRGIVGGCLEFDLKKELQHPSGSAPKLLPERRGWEWQVSAKQSVRVEFDPPLAKLYFEVNDPYVPRAFLVGENVRPGTHKVRMSISLSAGGEIAPSLQTRAGEVGPDWHPNTLSFSVSPVDLSFLNAADKPAGSKGRMRVQGEQFVYPDGTPARFWGTNVQAYALFTSSKEAIRQHAKRLAAMGFNLVRLHHHDSAWVVPNVFADPENTTRALRESSMRKLDFWVKSLTDEGIYVWIDLHTGRLFKPGDDVAGVAEISIGLEGKGFSYVNSDIEARMQEFARAYMTRKNVFTRRTYAQEPGILALLVTNENDLTTHFGGLMVPAENPVHARMFQSALSQVASQRALAPVMAEDWWRPGSARASLAKLEADFFLRAIKNLNRFAPDVPVATTSYWGEGRLHSLPALAVGSVLDTHSYGVAEHLSRNPRHEVDLLSNIALAHVAGMPLTVSEWAWETEIADRHLGALHFAAVASLQDWAAVMQFSYHQSGLVPPTMVESWDHSHDPGIMAAMPAAALMFRQGHVAPAKNAYHLPLTQDILYDTDDNRPQKMRAARTLTEQSRFRVTLPNHPKLRFDDGFGRVPANSTLVSKVDQDFIGPDSVEVVSDTGELRRNFAQGFHTVDTPMSQVAAGWIGGKTIDLKGMRVRLATPSAVIVVSSLTGQPIARARKLLLTTLGRVSPTAHNQLPFLAQPVAGSVLIKGLTGAWHLTALMPDGQRLSLGLRTASEQGLTLDLPAKTATHWFELTPTAY